MTRHFLAALPLVALAAALSGCPMDQGFGALGPGADGRPVEDPYWCCDPDEGACVCEGYWHCTEGIRGKQCEQENPRLPDDGGRGDWSCAYSGDLIVCSGADADHPDAGQDGEWSCTRSGGTVECSRSQDAGDAPDDGAGPWDCAYSSDGGLRSCNESSGDSGGGGTWDCTTARDGTTTCLNEAPSRPDGGEWSCVQVNGRDICEGDHMPDSSGDSGWDCRQQGEIVSCQNDQAQEPDSGGDAPWDCGWNDGRSITCIQRGDDGSLGGGDGTPQDGDQGNPGDDGNLPNDGNQGNPGGGEDGGGGGCQCPPGAWRYCDTPTYCSWGTQQCEEPSPGAAQWSPCVETAAPNNCWDGGMYDADAEQCAIDSGYCAQDFWDIDWDGDNQETLGVGCAELACVAPADDGGFGGWF